MPHQCTNCGRTFDDGSKEMLSGCPDCGGNKFQFQPPGSKRDRTTTQTSEPAEPASGAGQPETGDDRTEANVEREMPELAKDAERDEGSAEDPASDPARTRADVEREMPELAEEAKEQSQPEDAEYQTSTAEENRAQRDARSTPTTKEEIEEARRKMAEAEEERLSEVEGEDEPGSQRPSRGRGAPQGPPPEPPDEEAAEEFSLSGAVGPPEDQLSPNAASEEGSEEEAIRAPETDLSALRDELNDQFESIKITAPGQYELNLMELYDRKEYIISLQEDGRYVVDIPESHGLDE